MNANRGDSAQITRDYFDSLLVELRTIDAAMASTGFSLFGERFATPVMVAALSGLDRTRENGMADTARGAAAAGAPMWAGIGSEAELEAIIATGARTVKIVKPYADIDLIYRKLEHAEKAGALAVGMDTDYVFGGKRTRGFAMECPVSPKSLDEIKGFVKATGLPFIVKGVLSERDAYKALEAGAGGIVVSHHAGAVLDYSAPPLMVLPDIARLVGGSVPIFVDCGVTRGMDAFKALALGATAVCVGKAVIAGLTDNGAEGVRKAIEDISDELRWALCMTGSKDPAHIDPNIIRRLP
ncbi:MAG: alpha-hydroxy-acid oxidizing protein [Clostridiales Family XIII bacterium]|jgi:isopentenyl diphosphate isomerase/L-lactate dehydrogenase-like FMN-dependent dehydrogenase|nr:alpha-hydroxy-acid oxidizing protein [Clostridiales Family XIII bacterium]